MIGDEYLIDNIANHNDNNFIKKILYFIKKFYLKIKLYLNYKK